MKESDIKKGIFITRLPLPYVDGGVKAGFPSPAQDYVDRSLDFNREIIRHPSATFYCKVDGDSMSGAGIDEGDTAVIDRALEAEDGDIVLAWLNGEFTIKYLDLSEKRKGRIWLRSANDKYPDFKVTKDDSFEVWGVVAHVIKHLK